jgi:hypothetical protein
MLTPQSRFAMFRAWFKRSPRRRHLPRRPITNTRPQ